MVRITNPFKRLDGSHRDAVIPLQMVWHSDNDPSTLRHDEAAEEGDEDDAPLLHSDRLDLERLRAEIEKDFASSSPDSEYDRKSRIINKAIQDIGMGRYQWELFTLCGMGWLADK
jgi:hypothetical protein